jgi:hypothetical protein
MTQENRDLEDELKIATEELQKVEAAELPEESSSEEKKELTDVEKKQLNLDGNQTTKVLSLKVLKNLLRTNHSLIK